LHLFDRQADHAPAAVAAGMRRLVAASAEGLVAGAGDHEHADGLVVVGVMRGLNDLLPRQRAERVV